MLCRTRIALIGVFAMTAVVLQTEWPVIPTSFYEDLELSFYGRLEPLVSPPITRLGTPSRVAILEVDAETIKELGWPIERRHYAAMFERLRAAGHPWVLSLLHFQRVKTASEQVSAEDDLLIGSMTAYSRIIGTGLDAAQGEELDDEAEQLLGAKSLILRDQHLADDLPYLPLQIREDPMFIAAETRFGFPPRVGMAPVVYCLPMYVPDVSRSGNLVIPTGALYAVGYASSRPLALEGLELVWRDSETSSQEPPLEISERHCLKHTRTSTEDYLKERRMIRMSLVDFLKSDSLPSLTDMVVVLASAEGRKFRGPGSGSGDEVLAREHTLLARLLDGFLGAGTTRGQPLSTRRRFAWDPLIAGTLLIIGAFILKRWALLTLIGGALLVPLGEGALNLTDGRLAFPVQGAAFGTACVILTSAIFLSRSLRRYRTILSFNTKLQQACMHVNSLDELQDAVKSTLRSYAPHSHFLIGNFDEDFYQLQSDPTDLANQVARVASRYNLDLNLSEEQNMTVSQTALVYEHSWISPLDAKSIITARTTVERRGVALGLAKALTRIDDWNLSLARRMLETIGSGLRFHWGRIELVQLRRFSELRRLMTAQELAMGQAVQSLMLPKQLAGHYNDVYFQIAYRPYGAMAGDWVQTHLPEDTRRQAFLAIGDVVGKGASAALITSAIAAAWQQFRVRWSSEDAPDRNSIIAAIRDLDQMIRQLFIGRQYTTLSLAVLNGFHADLVSLGSPPWLLLSPAGEVTTVKTKTSGPLGLRHAAEISVASIDLAPGEMLLAYSDGVMDGAKARMTFKKAYADAIAQGIDPTFETIENIAIECGRVAALPDDMSILLLRRAAA